MTMPDRLTVIGPDERRDHFYLPPDMTCWFWGEYTPYEHTDGQNWNYSATNQLISNFKKKMERRGKADWHYKDAAVNQVAGAFTDLFAWQTMHHDYRVALIPIPPSRGRSDPLYDPRMSEVLRRVAQRVGLHLDIRDCLSFSGRYGASHVNDVRPTPDELYTDLTVDDVAARATAPPGSILVFDDVLTAGAHVAAVARKLRDVFPGASIHAAFVARRVFPNPFGPV